MLASLATALALPVAVRAQNGGSTPLAQLQFDIVGVRLVVDPPALTVPKNIATQINTSLTLPPGAGAETRDAIESLTSGALIEAELRGPELTPTRIVTRPGQPIPVPPLAIPGDYFLDNVRLVKNGQTILDATASDGRLATTIPIRVISEVFVTNVTSRPLSLDEIRGRGIVIDESNFRAVNFQVAFNIDGTPFTIDVPGGDADARVPAAAPDAPADHRTGHHAQPGVARHRHAAAAPVRSTRPELLDRGPAVLSGPGRRRRDSGSRHPADHGSGGDPRERRVPEPVLLRAADGHQRRAGWHAAGAA